jgi:hypothetical protein
MLRKIRAAQSIIEYTALVIIVSGAVAATTFYLSRALEVRQRHLAQELNETNR